MTSLRSLPWSRLLLAVIGVWMMVGIVQHVRGGPADAVRITDIDKARAEVTPKPNTAEDRPVGRVGGNGIVEPKAPETQLAVAVPGVIAVVRVQEGDVVAAGDLLMELDSSVERAALAAAEADASASLADLRRLTKGSRQEEIDASLADAEGSRARADLSTATLKRVEQLSTTGSVAADELDRARSQQKADQQSLALAEAKKRQTLAGFRSEDVLAARARFQAAEARRDQQRAAVARLQVRAPIAGTILEVKQRVGEYASPTQAVLVLGDTSEVRVRVDIEERDIARVKTGAKAEVSVDALPGKTFSATVVAVGQRMGRKNLRTDDPAERIDTKILEVVVRVDAPTGLVVGQRAMAFVDAP
jgi:HlyD family secretion protein